MLPCYELVVNGFSPLFIGARSSTDGLPPRLHAIFLFQSPLHRGSIVDY